MSTVSKPLPATRWFREFGRAPRILGLDVARGLAILGMAGAHIGESEAFDPSDRSTWTAYVSVPMSASTESLNAGIAASVTLYEIARKRATKS